MEAAKIQRGPVLAGGDRYRGRQRTVFGARIVDTKVSALDTNGGFCIFEFTDTLKGGPARHFHHDQEEWFYVIEGEYLIEIGDERYVLGPGDSVLSPRKAAHVWAHVGEGTGRLLVAFRPAGRMEAFFEELAKIKGRPQSEQMKRLFSSHGMELAGPPLSIE